jgi:hypothetical protein
LNQWNKDQTKIINLNLSISEFEKESVSSRLITLRKIAITKLRKLGFSKSTWSINKNHSYNRYTSTRENINNGRVNYVSAKLRKGKNIHYVSVQSFPSLTVNILEELYEWEAFQIANDIGDRKSDEKLAIANHIILSLKPATPNQIERVFTRVKPITPGKCYAGISTTFSGLFLSYCTYFFLTGIKSPLHLESQINEVVAQISEFIQVNEQPKP